MNLIVDPCKILVKYLIFSSTCQSVKDITYFYSSMYCAALINV